jgi:coproporphyrinogen III oxidase
VLHRDHIANTFMTIQDEICSGLESLDGKAKFQEDAWERPGGGGGRTRVISHGALLEKGGVNFSSVYGPLPDALKKEFGGQDLDFFATGVSIVLHPENPWVPIIHMNIRYFEMSNGVSWFGGGIDLTPHYVREDQAKAFHVQMKSVCDRFHPEYYAQFSKWADDYFFIRHRNETRGIGGIFFDHLKPENEAHKQQLFDFVCAVGRTFVPAYAEQVAWNRDLAYGEKEQQWQRLRRGRYVEFNLVWDRGTKFGLETNGRTESILMSLPENASWFYNYQPEVGSPEHQTLQMLQKGRTWL